MTWSELEEKGRVSRHQTSREELDGLRKAIARNLDDAGLAGLSPDNRFGLAYEAALLASKMAMACAGYRARGASAHQTTFVGLELALGQEVSRAAQYFERCRRKRNQLSYEGAGIAGGSEAQEILVEAARLRDTVEAWISKVHSGLAAGSN
jgi:hypothetical protein